MKVRLLVVTVVSVLWAGLAQAAPFTIHYFNGPDNNYPFLAGIVGFASSSNDLNAGSSNYVYLGGAAAPTPPGAGPTVGANSFTAATGIAERIETALWSIDANNVLTAQWINTNLSSPATTIGYAQGTLLLVGDPTAFQGTFGAFVPLKLVYVQNGACGCGFIDAFNANTNVNLGFIAASWNQFGEFTSTFTQSMTGALAIDSPPQPVPEPSSLVLLGLGISGLVARRKSARRR